MKNRVKRVKMEMGFIKAELRKAKLDKQIVNNNIYNFNTAVAAEKKAILEELFIQKIQDFNFVEYCIKKNQWSIEEIIQAHFQNLYCCVEQIVSCSKNVLN